MSNPITPTSPSEPVEKVLESSQPNPNELTLLEQFQQRHMKRVFGSYRKAFDNRRYNYRHNRIHAKVIPLTSEKYRKEHELIRNYMTNKRAYTTNYVAKYGEDDKFKGLGFHNHFSTQVDAKKILDAELDDNDDDDSKSESSVESHVDAILEKLHDEAVAKIEEEKVDRALDKAIDDRVKAEAESKAEAKADEKEAEIAANKEAFQKYLELAENEAKLKVIEEEKEKKAEAKRQRRKEQRETKAAKAKAEADQEDQIALEATVIDTLTSLAEDAERERKEKIQNEFFRDAKRMAIDEQRRKLLSGEAKSTLQIIAEAEANAEIDAELAAIKNAEKEGKIAAKVVKLRAMFAASGTSRAALKLQGREALDRYAAELKIPIDMPKGKGNTMDMVIDKIYEHLGKSSKPIVIKKTGAKA